LSALAVIGYMAKPDAGSILPLVLGIFFLSADLQADTSKTPVLTNSLKNHPSPYLALHAKDPVAWQEWSEKTVKLARAQNKLLYLSIGYFSCHWCHVMQKESYQNPEIAAFLNKYFIPVKIDRELEPALDASMIAFVERTRGIGGWPLNVFVTPDGYPLYGVLYEPPKNFMKIIGRLGKLWAKDPAQLGKLAREDVNKAKGPGEPRINKPRVSAYVEKLVIGVRGYADSLNGGFGEQSKFPSVPQLSFLLSTIKATGSRVTDRQKTVLREILILTLDQMANLGLRDHIGGGFFRYTVDPGWKTPHFEKMLYDNAQLASLYLSAGQYLNRPDYIAVARDTLDFLDREMLSNEGAYIAALSAIDSKGIEGGYYLWSDSELDKILTPLENQVFRLAWSVQDAPPFDQGYLPYAGMDIRQIAKKTSIQEKKVNEILSNAMKKLQDRRKQRSLPRDTKVLAGWNGLALSALVNAAIITKDQKYQAAAGRVRNYIVKQLWDGNSLKRSDVNGRAVGSVALEDYAYVAKGLFDWAKLTNKKPDFQIVEKILNQAWERFYGKQGWQLAEKTLIKTEGNQDVIADSVTPSPSAVIAGLSLELAEKDTRKYRSIRERALSALNSGHDMVNEDPYWYASHIVALQNAMSDNR